MTTLAHFSRTQTVAGANGRIVIASWGQSKQPQGGGVQVLHGAAHPVGVLIDAKHDRLGEAVGLRQKVGQVHTFGERFADGKAGRPPEPPRLKVRAPRMPKDGAIPLDADLMPDEIEYDEAAGRLLVGKVSSRTCRPRCGTTRSPASGC